jgi:hypothetical protein
MRVQDIREEKDSRSIYFVVGKTADKANNIEEDELTESSWMMQLFTDDEKDLATNKSRHYRLIFSNASGWILINVEDATESQQTDEDGDVAGTARTEQVRDTLARNLD